MSRCWIEEGRSTFAIWHCHMFQPIPFHVQDPFQWLQEGVFDKMQHAPSFVCSKQPTHIVLLLKGPATRDSTYDPQHMEAHQGCPIHPLRARQKFEDIAATMEGLRWQLTQAAIAAERTWVVDAMARHCCVAPRKQPREPWQSVAPFPAKRSA